MHGASRVRALALAALALALVVRATSPEMLSRSASRALQRLAVRADRIALTPLAEGLADKLWSRIVRILEEVSPSHGSALMPSRWLTHEATVLLLKPFVLLVVELRLVIVRPLGHVWLILVLLEQHRVDLAIVVRGIAVVAVPVHLCRRCRLEHATLPHASGCRLLLHAHRAVRHERVRRGREDRRSLRRRIHNIVAAALCQVSKPLDVRNELTVLNFVDRHLALEGRQDLNPKLGRETQTHEQHPGCMVMLYDDIRASPRSL